MVWFNKSRRARGPACAARALSWRGVLGLSIVAFMPHFAARRATDPGAFLAALNTSTTEHVRELRHLFENKVVAIVGPAAHTYHDGVALAAIAKADTVVRPNLHVDHSSRTLRLPPRQSRCDVVYSAGLAPGQLQHVQTGRTGMLVPTAAGSALSNSTLEIYAERGIRAVILSELKFDRISHFRSLQPPTGLLLATARRYPAKLARLRTGTKAIIDVLRHAPARVMLFGFDFYQTSTHAFAGHYASFEAAGVHRRHHGSSRHHDASEELRYFRRHLWHRVQIDDHLRRVLGNGLLYRTGKR